MTNVIILTGDSLTTSGRTSKDQENCIIIILHRKIRCIYNISLRRKKYIHICIIYICIMCVCVYIYMCVYVCIHII